MKRIILCVAMLALCGCQEQWGKGDPGPLWQGYFGNSNNSRLDFKQTNILNGHAGIINEQTNKINRQSQTILDLIGRVHDLEARPVFDPNECACIEITEPIDPGINPFDITETVPCEVTE